MAEVFISYHTKTGGEAVHHIVSVLEENGITCWYAPRDVGDNYAQSIVEAIRNCRIFLLVLNEKSNTSAHVLNEINCAFDRFKEHEDIVLLPFRIDECSLSDDIYYYLGRIHIMDGSLPPEKIRLQELLGRVSAILGKKPELCRKANIADSDGNMSRKSPKTYRLIGSMVYPDSSFTGREKELKQMSDYLSGVENKVFLVGMGGMGKSEMARMYLKQNAASYDVIIWVTFAGSLADTIGNDSSFAIGGISRENYPEDSDDAYFKRKLNILKEIADNKVLIAIDNFDVTDDVYLEEFCSGSYGVIFTTRYHQKNGRIPELEVGKINDEEELLTIFSGEYKKSLKPEEKEYVKEILRQLDGHPLSIRLVASAMKSRRIQPVKMLLMLKKGVQCIKNENAPAADMIFGQLRQVFQISTLTEDEQFILKNLSLSPLCGISVEQFFEWCEIDNFEVIDGLIEKNWIEHNPITDEVHLHPLISDLMQEELTKSPKCCMQYIKNLEKACTNTFNIGWEEKQKLLECAKSACERTPEEKELIRRVCLARASMLHDMFRFDESCRIYQKALDYAEKTEDRIQLIHHISHMQILGGSFEEGCKTAQKGLDELKNIPLSEMSKLAGYYRNELLRRISEGNRELGNYSDAIFYAREAVATCEGFYISARQSSLGWAEYHLARSLYESGELTESEETIRHAFRLFEEVSDNWSQMYCYELLGQILMKKNRFEEALQCNQKGYDIRNKLYGPDSVMASMGWFGNIYRKMGEEKQALDYYIKAAEGYRKCGCFKLEKKVLNVMEQKEKLL